MTDDERFKKNLDIQLQKLIHKNRAYLQTIAKINQDLLLHKWIPAGTTRNEPSGDQANLLKKDGNVSSWKRWYFVDCITIITPDVCVCDNPSMIKANTKNR